MSLVKFYTHEYFKYLSFCLYIIIASINKIKGIAKNKKLCLSMLLEKFKDISETIIINVDKVKIFNLNEPYVKLSLAVKVKKQTIKAIKGK